MLFITTGNILDVLFELLLQLRVIGRVLGLADMGVWGKRLSITLSALHSHRLPTRISSLFLLKEKEKKEKKRTLTHSSQLDL